MRDKYSDKDLTDYNFDEEYEELEAIFGRRNSDNWEVYDKSNLPEGFCRQEAISMDGKDIGCMAYHKSGPIKPNISSDHFGVLVEGWVAFEFKNCFLAIEYKDCY